MTITSADNQTIKRIRALREKKYRREYGCFALEGENIISAVPHCYEIMRYIIEDGKQNAFSDILRPEIEIIVVSPAVMKSISETVSPPGLIAEVRIRSAAPMGSMRRLILDRVRDAGNLGAILRTAAASGFVDVYAVDCADAFNPKAVRASMGGIFHCNILEFESGAAEAVVSELKAGGFVVFAADMHGENIFETNKPAGKTALIIGNEAQGVSAELLAAADKLLGIPMRNVESLNAAVSAGILMYFLSGGSI